MSKKNKNSLIDTSVSKMGFTFLHSYAMGILPKNLNSALYLSFENPHESTHTFQYPVSGYLD